MKRAIIFGILAVLTSTTAFAQAASHMPELPVPHLLATPQQPPAIPLYPDMKTGALSSERWAMFGDKRVVRNITFPTLTAFLPDPKKATGAAVIVLPGGGFWLLAMDEEGYPIAQWLADHGIAAFVLKYRTNPTPYDHAQAFAIMSKSIADSFAHPELRNERVTPFAAKDAIAAVQLVRAEAGKWDIDPKRVGMMGFSAGAITTMNATLQGAPGERPAFIGYIYGHMESQVVPNDAPPMFAALANDDPLMGGQSFGIVDAWIKAGRPVELHAYEKGGHGFGTGHPGTTTSLVLPEFLEWMQDRGELGPKR